MIWISWGNMTPDKVYRHHIHHSTFCRSVKIRNWKLKKKKKICDQRISMSGKQDPKKYHKRIKLGEKRKVSAITENHQHVRHCILTPKKLILINVHTVSWWHVIISGVLCFYSPHFDLTSTFFCRCSWNCTHLCPGNLLWFVSSF